MQWIGKTHYQPSLSLKAEREAIENLLEEVMTKIKNFYN